MGGGGAGVRYSKSLASLGLCSSGFRCTFSLSLQGKELQPLKIF